MQWLMKGVQLRGGRLCMCGRSVKKGMTHSRAHHVLRFFRICKGLSTRWKILQSTQSLYQESSPSLWWSGSVADCQHLSCFWSHPETGQLAHAVSPPCWQKCVAVHDLQPAQPDTPTISHVGAGFDGQLAVGLGVRNSVCPEKDSDTNWAGGSKSERLFKGHRIANSAWQNFKGFYSICW